MAGKMFQPSKGKGRKDTGCPKCGNSMGPKGCSCGGKGGAGKKPMPFGRGK